MYKQENNAKKKGNESSKQASILSYFNKNSNNVSTTNSNTRVEKKVIETKSIITSSNVVDLTSSPAYQNKSISRNSNSSQFVDLTQSNNRNPFVSSSAIQKLDLGKVGGYSKPIQNRSMSIQQQSFQQRYQHIKQATSTPTVSRSIFSGYGNSGSNKNGVYVVSSDPNKPSKGPYDNHIKRGNSGNSLTNKKRDMPWGNFNNNEKKSQSSSFNSGSTSLNSSNRTNAKKSNGLNKGIMIDKSKLSKSQLEVVDAIFRDGKNVFFTGSAGTGKSLLLRYIIEEICNREDSYSRDPNVRFRIDQRKKFDLPETLAVTASTGIAAFNIGGCTVHSFSGIGLGNGTIHELVTKINKNRKSAKKWMGLKYLIIDEISMLNGELFDKLEQVACKLKGTKDKPFGGIQLILAGDFLQLPPVSRGGEAKFCFESECWKKCIDRTIVLTEIFRQRDSEFTTILNEARIGQVSAKGIETFKSLSRQLPSTGDGIQAAELFSTRSEVDRANMIRLKGLHGELHVLKANDFGKVQHVVDNMDNYTLFPKVLELKVNAQVMLLKNMTYEHPSLVNGSLGIVIGFNNINEMDAKTRDKLQLVGPIPEQEIFNKSKDIYDTQYPVVRFPGGIEITITPEESTYEVNNEILGTRSQVPLLLAWAMSIHKSQGQTLQKVKVDLLKIFERGQAYVALSRATTLSGLQVLNFTPDKIRAHPKVIQYYQQHINKK